MVRTCGAISISPSVDYIERAYDQSKYGEFSQEPYIDIVIPSMIDPDMAHLENMSCPVLCSMPLTGYEKAAGIPT
jgi:phytoene dehydrogenase-like protein